jgi:phospholipid/cholesterol/gamma-HCH transport system substrate-binding protein
VRQDSRAALRILQLLSGEKFVEIIPGSSDKEPLPERSVLDTVQEQALLEQAGIAAENLNEITISLKNILDKLERGEGLIGQMINDPEFGKAGLEAVRASMENLEAITGDLRRGRGVVGRLLRDEEFANKTESLFTAMDRVADKIGEIDMEAGALGALLAEGGPGQRAIEDYAATAASMRRLSERLESEDGVLGQLLSTDEDGQAFGHDLRRLVGNLAEISDKINSGEGTLGALVNDRSLYDGMEDVVVGVNDSKFARWLLRRYQKKGIETQDENAAASETDSAKPAPQP